MAVTREGLPKLVLAGAAAAPAILLLRVLLLLRDLWRHGAAPRALFPAAACAALSALAVCLVLLALRLRPERRAETALAVVSCAAAAWGAELWLGRDVEVAGHRLVARLHVVDQLGGPAARTYPAVEPVHLVWARAADAPSYLTADGAPLLPLADRARSRLVACQDESGGGWRTYETDEHGFLNPPGLWARAPVAVAAVGDSFTAGTCVPPEASMVALVRRRFPAAVNLGVPGSGPLMMLGVVREYLPALRPREVLWCHFAGNDLLDLRREAGHALLRRYLEEDFQQGLLARQEAIDRALDDYLARYLRPDLERRVIAHRAVADILTLRALRSRIGLAFSDPYALRPTEADYALFGAILDRARRAVAAWGGTLRFVYLPAGTPPWHLARRAEEAVTVATRERTLAIVRALGIPIVDVEAAFEARSDLDALFACPACHYTEAGYRVAADAILAGLPGGAQP